MDVILGIDPGTTMGWAAGSVAAPFMDRSGAMRLTRPGDHPGNRYHAALSVMQGRIARGDAAILVAYELPHASGRLAAQYHYGIIAVCQMFAAQVGADVIGVHSATLKKHATGNGRAEKDQMVAAAYRARLVPKDHVFASHDEADAIWIMDYARAIYRRNNPAARQHAGARARA